MIFFFQTNENLCLTQGLTTDPCSLIKVTTFKLPIRHREDIVRSNPDNYLLLDYFAPFARMMINGTF
jgi:hypothetical protein